MANINLKLGSSGRLKVKELKLNTGNVSFNIHIKDCLLPTLFNLCFFSICLNVLILYKVKIFV